MASILWLSVLVALVPVYLTIPDNTDDVKTMLTSLQEKVAKQEHQIRAQQAELEKLGKTINSLEATDKKKLTSAADNQKNVSRATLDTLFLAIISETSISVSDGDVIIWDSAPINPGGHFNTVTGGYTAPYDGFYQFSVAKASGDEGVSHFFLLVDENRYARYDLAIVSGSRHPTGTATINIELTAGQIVRVEHYGSSSLVYGTDSSGYIQSWFTGFLHL